MKTSTLSFHLFETVNYLDIELAMKPLCFFSGVHGSGKTTLIRDLSLAYPLRYTRLSKGFPLPNAKTFVERQISRYSRAYLQDISYREIVCSPANRIFLADRSVIDIHAYTLAFRSMEWLTDQELATITAVSSALFHSHHESFATVFVSPPIDFIRVCLAKRWASSGTQKWRESNFQYLESVYTAFQTLLHDSPENVLVITDTDRLSRVSIVHNWLQAYFG